MGGANAVAVDAHVLADGFVAHVVLVMGLDDLPFVLGEEVLSPLHHLVLGVVLDVVIGVVGGAGFRVGDDLAEGCVASCGFVVEGGAFGVDPGFHEGADALGGDADEVGYFFNSGLDAASSLSFFAVTLDAAD